MLTPGFADPALDSQRCFRAVLEAMSRPGRVQQLPADLADPPAPLGLAAGAVLLTLADADTPVWIDAAAAPAADWLRFHAGCPLVAAPGDAQFVLACGGMPGFETLAQGTEEAPENSATLVLQVASLARGAGLRLTGPGIATEHCLHVEGLPPGFALGWARNAALFPRGVDVILCAGGSLAALPRSLRIEELG
jgi:alpha-D-ribose 1-methylphosphonate 5-triphosphate synthase subunit PhnH